MIVDPSQERNAPETRHTSPPIELPHGFKKQRLEETKDSKKQRTYTKEDFKNSSIAGPTWKQPARRCGLLFYSTNKLRMQAFSAARSKFPSFNSCNLGSCGNSGNLVQWPITSGFCQSRDYVGGNS